MKVSRKFIIILLFLINKFSIKNIPFLIMCLEYDESDSLYAEICLKEFDNILWDKKYKTFEIWKK